MGKPIAVLARDWVNEITAAVLTRYPQLHVEWGLHATSILENYRTWRAWTPELKSCGRMPAYSPLSV